MVCCNCTGGWCAQALRSRIAGRQAAVAQPCYAGPCPADPPGSPAALLYCCLASTGSDTMLCLTFCVVSCEALTT